MGEGGKRCFAPGDLVTVSLPSGVKDEDCDSVRVSLSALVAVSENSLVLQSVCRKCCVMAPEDQLIMCEAFGKTCLTSMHIGCLEVPLTEVPSGPWFCSRCLPAADKNAKDEAQKERPSVRFKTKTPVRAKSTVTPKAKGKVKPTATAAATGAKRRR